MLNRSTTWAVALLAATFGAGVVVGIGGRAMWVRYASAASPERAHGVERLMGELDRDLRLTPVQRDSVHRDRKSTRLNSSHSQISYAVFCLKKKKPTTRLQSFGGPSGREDNLGTTI